MSSATAAPAAGSTASLTLTRTTRSTRSRSSAHSAAAVNTVRMPSCSLPTGQNSSSSAATTRRCRLRSRTSPSHKLLRASAPRSGGWNCRQMARAACRPTGTKTCSSRGCGMPAAMRSASSPPAATSSAPIPMANNGRFGARATAIPTTWPSTPTANSSSTTPTWNGILDRRGIAPRESTMRPAAANWAGAAAPASGPPAIPIACRP